MTREKYISHFFKWLKKINDLNEQFKNTMLDEPVDEPYHKIMRFISPDTMDVIFPMRLKEFDYEDWEPHGTYKASKTWGG